MWNSLNFRIKLSIIFEIMEICSFQLFPHTEKLQHDYEEIINALRNRRGWLGGCGEVENFSVLLNHKKVIINSLQNRSESRAPFTF